MRKTVSEVDYATKAIITFITDCLQVNELPQFVNFLDLLSPIYFNIESPEFTIQSNIMSFVETACVFIGHGHLCAV